MAATIYDVGRAGRRREEGHPDIIVDAGGPASRRADASRRGRCLGGALLEPPALRHDRVARVLGGGDARRNTAQRSSAAPATTSAPPATAPGRRPPRETSAAAPAGARLGRAREAARACRAGRARPARPAAAPSRRERDLGDPGGHREPPRGRGVRAA